MADENTQDTQPTETPTATPPAKTGDARTFTQDEVNEMMGDRAERAKKVAKTELLKSLGFESETELKQLVKSAKDAQEAQKTELEKAQSTLEETRRKLEEGERKRKENLVSAEVIFHASQMGFINPKEALKLIDITKIQVGDDDAVSGADEAVKALAESSKHLLKTNQRTPNPGATNPAGGKPGGEPSIIEAIRARSGRAVDTSVFLGGDGGAVVAPEE